MVPSLSYVKFDRVAPPARDLGSGPTACSEIIKNLKDTMPVLSENRSGSLVLRVAGNNVVALSLTQVLL